MQKRLTFKPAHHLDPSSLRHAFCTLIIASLAFLFLSYFKSSEGSWLLLSCLLLSQAGFSAEAHWQTPWQTFFYLICGFLTASSVFLVSLCAFQFFPTAALLFVISLVAGYLGWRTRQHFFAAFVLILLALLAAFSPVSLDLAFERFYLILLGSLLVMALRFLFFLRQKARAYEDAKIIFSQQLKKLYQLIFESAGPATPLLRKELEESHFQIAWSDCLSTLRNLKAKAEPAYGAKLDRLWDLTLSLGSLRYRLTDFSVLTMSQDEMQALLKALLAILDEVFCSPLKDTNPSVFDALQTVIQNFEELYQSMLQTVAKEPLVLLLFIQDLYALKEEFEQLASMDQNKKGQA